MRLIVKFALIFAFLVSAAFGAQSGSMAAHHDGTVGFSAEGVHSPADMAISAIPGSGEHDHCPKKDGKSAEHIKECCAASCNAFEATDASPLISARSNAPMDVSWTVTTAEGIQLESPYRPPEA